MNDEKPSVTDPGGFCGPEGHRYELNPVAPAAVRDAFPRLTVQRGGIYPRPGTPEWERAELDRQVAESMNRMIARHIGGILEAQNRVLDLACFEALKCGWDVHIQRPPYSLRHGGQTRFIGIELAERTTGRMFPTLHEHSDDYRWDDLDDLD